MDEYKTYIWLIQCMIRGLEQTCTNHGIGGLASAMMLLELCHTHYLDTSSSTVSPNRLQKPQVSPHAVLNFFIKPFFFVLF
ncbi:unnamed protein product [Trichobilharzia regenti]|nr:unnamed protein product [Trichobilharzia regenti]